MFISNVAHLSKKSDMHISYLSVSSMIFPSAFLYISSRKAVIIIFDSFTCSLKRDG